MYIHQPDTAAHQMVALYEEKNLVVFCLARTGQCVEQSNDLLPVAQVPASQLPEDERMDDNSFRFQ